MEYTTQRISPELYTDLQLLKNRSMGYLQDMSDIKRKFDTSCFGIRDIGFFARDKDNNPAAYYGVFPMVVVNNGKDYVIAQSGDTMTDPDHRKKGLFVQLAKEAYDFAGTQGIDFIFGFPNEFSYPGFKNKLDWIFFGNMQEFSIKSSAIPLCELAKKYNFFRPFYSRLLKIRLAKYIVNINSESIKGFSHGKNEFYIKKDLNFFNYKKGENKFLVEINNFKFFFKAQTHLYIGEVAKFEESRIDDFILTLEKLTKLVQSRKLIMALSENHWLYSFMMKKMEPKESLPIGFYKYGNDFPFEKLILSMSDYDTF